ncbi:hypothetical protein H4V96_001933 [Janthinobacterium sp. CG_23.4]|nr:hypothetical protein [Janthinobacterium sp. CG_23.4]
MMKTQSTGKPAFFDLRGFFAGWPGAIVLIGVYLLAFPT